MWYADLYPCMLCITIVFTLYSCQNFVRLSVNIFASLCREMYFHCFLDIGLYFFELLVHILCYFFWVAFWGGIGLGSVCVCVCVCVCLCVCEIFNVLSEVT